MRLVGNELEMDGKEAVTLGLVSLLFLTFDEGEGVPCGPSHYFCAAANRASDETIRSMFRNPTKKKLRRIREFFLDASEPCILNDGERRLSSHETNHWVNVALSLDVLSDEAIATVYELGLVLGGKPILDG